MDWFETGGVIEYHIGRSRAAFAKLESARAAAQAANEPWPHTLGGKSVLVHPRGIGTGRQARLEYRIEWSGVLIAVSPRLEAKRTLANYYLKVAGEPCVVLSLDAVREAVMAMVDDLGGILADEWIKRIDFCLDLPGLCVRDELQPAFDRGQFLTNFTKWNPFDGKAGKKGFVADSPGRLRLNVYDKRYDAQTRHDGVYLLAMRDRRWGGSIPDVATRVEFQIKRPWLRANGLDGAEEVLADAGSILGKLLSFGPRPPFVLTDRTPDRENKHQSRCEPHRLWQTIAARFQAAAGEPTRRLVPVARHEASLLRHYSMGVGALTSAGAKMGVLVETPEDCGHVMRLLMNNAGKTEEDIGSRFEKKSRKIGTWDGVIGFDPFADGLEAAGRAA